MVVRVPANIFEIWSREVEREIKTMRWTVVTVVFSSGSDALLGIESALDLGHLRVGIDCAKEDGFELEWAEHLSSVDEILMGTDLVHACIGKEEGRVLERDRRRRGDENMVLVAEKVEKLLPDAGGRPRTLVGHDFRDTESACCGQHNI